MNCADPASTANPTPAEKDIDVDTIPPSKDEVQKAIKSYKKQQSCWCRLYQC